MKQSHYSQVIPNSHTYGSLRNFMVSYEYHAHRTEDLTPAHILIGLKNTIKKGYSLKQITFPDGGQGPCFLTIEDIIEYVESDDWTIKDFIFRVENTLKNGYDLKNKYIMEYSEVYKKIDGELKYQDLRWVIRRDENGTPDAVKPPAEWINYMEFHISEAKKEVYHLNDEEALAQIRKVVALGVRALMIHGCPERLIPTDIEDNFLESDDKAE